MSNPKPTPAEKATLKMIRAETRSVNDQIRTMTRLARDSGQLHDRISRQLGDLYNKSTDLIQRAKSLQP